MLGLNPKDFDVSTSATPEQVRKLFRRCRLVGRRFRLAHVMFGREMIEVATFRGGHDETEQCNEGRVLDDNVYGSLEEDAFRRDLTVNALYYDPANEVVIDHMNATDDIKAKRIRLIGDPETRFREDPVRMLRVARFMAKLNFTVDPEVEKAIFAFGHLLENIPSARLFDEVLKLFQTGYGERSFNTTQYFDVFQYLLPMTYGCLERDDAKHWSNFIKQALINTDARIAEGKSTNSAFMYATLLWPPVREYLTEQGAKNLSEGAPAVMQIQHGATEVFDRQIHYTAIPKRLSSQIRDIWTLQPRLEKYTGKRALMQLSHPRFRAGYDFLLLRESVGEATGERGDFWTELQAQNPDIKPTAHRAEDASWSAPNNTRRRRASRRRRG